LCRLVVSRRACVGAGEIDLRIGVRTLRNWLTPRIGVGMDQDVSVKELIQKVSEELLESQQERLASGRRAVFEVSELDIEISFVVSRSRQGRGGINLQVVTAGGTVGLDDQRTQRMTLKLVAASSGDTPGLRSLDYDDDLPVRPRRRLDENQ
jgi:Trypsin-co-occurring domain 2